MSVGRTLLLAVGNKARQDDALAPLLAQQLGELKLADVDISIDYQLCVEHALDLASYDQVVFMDAARIDEPFQFRELPPAQSGTLTSHRVDPAVVLHMAHKLFNAQTRGYTLASQGHDFDAIAEGLSPGAQDNLKTAHHFLQDWLIRPD